MKKRDIFIVVLSIATALACVGFTIWGNFKNGGVLTIDAFMGVIAALIGVCATIIVGFQIASYLEQRETKDQIADLQKERKRLESISANISKMRSDLAIAFVAISADASNSFLKIVSMISSITVDEINGEKSMAILSRYKSLQEVLLDPANSELLEFCQKIKLSERLQNVQIPKDLVQYNDIMALHYEIMTLLNKPVNVEKKNS